MSRLKFNKSLTCNGLLLLAIVIPQGTDSAGSQITKRTLRPEVVRLGGAYHSYPKHRCRGKAVITVFEKLLDRNVELEKTECSSKFLLRWLSS